MTDTPQWLRVLRSLRAAGPRGITQNDWSGLVGTPDRGKPITRLAARIIDLRDGHDCVIDTRKDRGTTRYVLVREPVRLEDHRRAPEPALFQLPPDNALVA